MRHVRQGESVADDRTKLNLPYRPFLYTLDQIAVILSIQEVNLKSYLFFEGRQSGRAIPDEIRVVNIAPRDAKPDWRCEERELMRWMKRKGFRYVDR